MYCFFQLKPSGGLTKINWIFFFIEKEMLCLQRQAWRHLVGYEKTRTHCCWKFGFSLGLFFGMVNMTRPCQAGWFTAPWVTSAREKPQRSGNVIIPTPLTLLRPHLEYFVQLWSPSPKETMNHGKGAAEPHQRDPQAVGGLGRRKEMKELLFIPEQRRPREKPIPRAWESSRRDGGQEEMHFSSSGEILVWNEKPAHCK